MAFTPAPNCVELDIIASLDGQPIENTFHYRLPAPATAAQLVIGINALFARYAAAAGLLSDHYQLIKGYGRALDTANSPSTEVNPAAAIAGTDGSGPLPNNVSFALTRRTGLAGRKMRGRLYWPGLTQGMKGGDNVVTNAWAQLAVNWANTTITTMAALAPSFVEIILHKADGTHNDVVSYGFSDLNMDSMRRRLPGHNIHH